VARKGFTPEQIINDFRETKIRYNQRILIASHPDDFTTRDELYQQYYRQAVTANLRNLSWQALLSRKIE
jgi:hypothetical protein